MRGAWRGAFPDRGALAAGGFLAVVAAAAWLIVVRSGSGMQMEPSAGPAGAAAFTLMWTVMMAAMMLPSAAPMILLYRSVTLRLASSTERAIPTTLFAAVYLLVWAATGIPVFGLAVATRAAAAHWPGVQRGLPYAVAVVLALAGVYQLTPWKEVCLRHCEAPLSFLMTRWRAGFKATAALALRHAAYCVGCCWGLMAILVAGGAMSLPWVVLITLLVYAEKVLPGGVRTARFAGWVLLLLAAAVAIRPELAAVLRGPMADRMPGAMPGAMPGM